MNWRTFSWRSKTTWVAAQRFVQASWMSCRGQMTSRGMNVAANMENNVMTWLLPTFKYLKHQVMQSIWLLLLLDCLPIQRKVLVIACKNRKSKSESLCKPWYFGIDQHRHNCGVHELSHKNFVGKRPISASAGVVLFLRGEQCKARLEKYYN